jgi:hypothetical protein
VWDLRNSPYTIRQRENGMRNSKRIDLLEKELDIMNSKFNILALMFKDYVDSETSQKIESGKWYPTIDSKA